MQQRFNLLHTAPAAYNAMLAFTQYMDQTALSGTHKELIKIRASQINGCAFCLDMHTHDARKAGETEQRIYILNAWRDTGFFTAEERAILALTEEVTLIHQGGVSDKTYQDAVNILGVSYTADVLAAITIINSWNRIAITTQLQPPLRKA